MIEVCRYEELMAKEQELADVKAELEEVNEERKRFWKIGVEKDKTIFKIIY